MFQLLVSVSVNLIILQFWTLCVRSCILIAILSFSSFVVDDHKKQAPHRLQGQQHVTSITSLLQFSCNIFSWDKI